MAVAVGSTNTVQCPTGQVLINGVCSTPNASRLPQASGGLSGTQGGMAQPVTTTTMNPTATPESPVSPPVVPATATAVPATATAPTISSIYGDFRGAIQQTTDANIQAARQTAEMQQDTLNRQLAEQRQDFLRNRQDLQRETFLRGRNILSNLANRGLATSGLLQLGDVQRTIATGQQMTGLSEAFERARQGLTAQQQGVQTGLQQFEAGQQSQLAQQLAGLSLQERQANIQEAERITALVEDTISAGQTATPQQAALLNQIYAATAAGDTEALQKLLAQAEVGGVATEGSLTQAFGQTPGYTVTSLVDGVKSQGGNLSSFEENALIDVVSNSDMLKQDSPFMADLAKVPKGTQVTATVRTKANKAGLNDEYFIQLPSGQEYELDGKELAVLLMNNAITVTPEIALSIAQRAGGRLATGLGVVGNRSSSVIIPYLEWLKKNNINEKTVTNPIR